jgi:hypothetical protein
LILGVRPSHYYYPCVLDRLPFLPHGIEVFPVPEDLIGIGACHLLSVLNYDASSWISCPTSRTEFANVETWMIEIHFTLTVICTITEAFFGGPTGIFSCYKSCPCGAQVLQITYAELICSVNFKIGHFLFR